MQGEGERRNRVCARSADTKEGEYVAGYIKLYRDIQEHWTWQDKPFSKGQAWIDLLMMANHDENKSVLGNEIILVERGCLITSEVKLAKRWGWSRCKVRAFLDLLASDEMIDKKTDTKKTYLKILNYSVWQDLETTKKQRKDSVQTAFRQRSDTNKNDKNVKNEKNNKTINSFISAQHLSMTEEEYNKLVTTYGKKTVDLKIDYARNYSKLKNYKSLYLTLNNWLRSDKKTQPQISNKYDYDGDDTL